MEGQPVGVRRSVYAGAVRSGDQGSSGGKRAYDVEERGSGYRIQAEWGRCPHRADCQSTGGGRGAPTLPWD